MRLGGIMKVIQHCGRRSKTPPGFTLAELYCMILVQYAQGNIEELAGITSIYRRLCNRHVPHMDENERGSILYNLWNSASCCRMTEESRECCDKGRRITVHAGKGITFLAAAGILHQMV